MSWATIVEHFARGMLDAVFGCMYSKAKILGHSIHPMLVGFPVAFYTATLASYVAFTATSNSFWLHLGLIANVAGVVGALCAAVPGFMDWAMAIPGAHPAKKIGAGHMALNVSALVLFAVDAWLQYGHPNELVPSAGVAIGLAGAGMALTLAAGFLGWTMVQKHHIGVDASTETERERAHPGRPVAISNPNIPRF